MDCLTACVRACVRAWMCGGVVQLNSEVEHWERWTNDTQALEGREEGCAAFTKPTHASNPFNSLGAAILLVPLKVRKGCALVHATERPMSWSALNTNHAR